MSVPDQEVAVIYCTTCGAEVCKVFEPASIMIEGTAGCAKHGGFMDGYRFGMPPDTEVPRVIRIVW